MNFSRGLVFAAAALAASLAASVASSGAAAADGLRALQRPLAPALLQLAQGDEQPTRILTEEQRAKIKSALEDFTPEDVTPEKVKQAAADILTGIDQYMHGVASSGTDEQRARLAARVHRAYREWKKDHDTPARDDLGQLLIKLAAIGVPVEDAIVPAVQHVREAAARATNTPAAPASGDHPAEPVIVQHHR